MIATGPLLQGGLDRSEAMHSPLSSALLALRVILYDAARLGLPKRLLGVFENRNELWVFTSAQ